MTKGLKKWLQRCILIMGGAATLFLWENAYMVWSSMEQGFDTVSVRFEEKADFEQVQEALRSSGGESPTFWGQEESDNLMSEYETEPKTVDIFHFYGKGEEVMPAQFLAGDYPPTVVDGGCVVSSSLSDELWNSRETIGEKLWSGQREYQVYGIFDSPKKILLVQQHPRENVEYSAMELTASPEQDGRRVALDLVERAGLPAPKNIINGPGFCWLLYQLALLPFYVLLVMALWRIRRVAWPRWGKCCLLLGGLILFLWLLVFPYPSLLQSVGENWTSLGFWQELLNSCRVHFSELFTLLPTYRDALMERQVAALAISALLASGGMVYLVKQVIYPYCLPVLKRGEE